MSEASSAPSALSTSGVAPEVQTVAFLFLVLFSFGEAKEKKNMFHAEQKNMLYAKQKKKQKQKNYRSISGTT